jgi:hypothetical protein
MVFVTWYSDMVYECNTGCVCVCVIRVYVYIPAFVCKA